MVARASMAAFVGPFYFELIAMARLLFVFTRNMPEF
jgi:hypothetical protein